MTEVLGDMRIDEVDSETGDVSLVTLAGSIVDGRADDDVNVTGNSIDLDANGGSIGDPSGANDLEIDSASSAAGDVGMEASDSIYVTEVDGTLTLVLAEALAGDIRITVRETDPDATPTAPTLDEDLDLIHDGAVQFTEGADRDVPRGRIAALAGFVLLRIGDDVTTSPNSEILAGESIDIYGDWTNADAGYGTTMVLRGDIVPGEGHLTRIWGDTDVDTFQLGDEGGVAGGTAVDSAGYIRLGGNTRIHGSQNLSATDEPDGEDRFTVYYLQSMNVAAGHTLMLDGQAETDTYDVYTSGSRGSSRNYVINVLDTGAPLRRRRHAHHLGREQHAERQLGAGRPVPDRRHLPAAPRHLDRRRDRRPAGVRRAAALDPRHRGAERRGAAAGRRVRRRADQLRHRDQRPADRQRAGRQRLLRHRRQQRDHDARRRPRQRHVPDRPALRPQARRAGAPARPATPAAARSRRGTCSGPSPPRAAGSARASASRSSPQGGAGDDTFIVYSNQAAAAARGRRRQRPVHRARVRAGRDDRHVRRRTRRQRPELPDRLARRRAQVAMPKLTSGFSTAAETDIRTGGGQNQVQYNVNAPVSIDGGNGIDKVVVLGTEFADHIVVTERAIYGAGLAVTYANVELLEIDGLEGDDTFDVLSTRAGVATRVIGGLGSDTINVAGDVAGDVSRATSRARAARSTTRSARSTRSTTASSPTASTSIVARPQQGQVVIEESGGFTAVREGGAGRLLPDLPRRAADRERLRHRVRRALAAARAAGWAATRSGCPRPRRSSRPSTTTAPSS